MTSHPLKSARFTALAAVPALVLGVLAAVAVVRSPAHPVQTSSSPAPAPAPALRLAAASAASIPPGVPAGTVLRSVPGQVRSGPGWHWNGTAVWIDTNNVHLDRLDIMGAVHNDHSGMVVSRSRIRCAYEKNWCVTMGQGSTLTQDDIGGGANLRTIVPAIGVLSGDYRRAILTNNIAHTNIRYTVHGMRVDGDTNVAFSHIYGMPMGDPGFTTAHTDAIMCTAGHNVFVHDNRIETGNTSTFFVQWETGNVGIGNYYLLRNLFVAITKNRQQSSYGIMIENKGINGPITLANNQFTSGWQVGPILMTRSTKQSGNVWFLTNRPVPINYN